MSLKAFKGQIYHWDRFYRYVTTPPEKPEDLIWPEDPIFCLACTTTIHFLDSFTQSLYDPIAFKQLKEDAPADLPLKLSRVNSTAVDEFVEEVMTRSEKTENFIWPNDPLYGLACVITVHFINSFMRSVHDPIAFEQQKEHAPVEWSFSSLEEQDGLDSDDWWKTP